MKILIKREQRKRVCFAENEKSRRFSSTARRGKSTKFKQIALILMSLLMVCCTKDDEVKAQTMTQKMFITIDGQTQAVTLVERNRVTSSCTTVRISASSTARTRGATPV